jgi:rhodanese-related sulfurtransferase
MRKLSLFVLLSGIAFLFLGCANGKGTAPKGSEVTIEKAAIKFAEDIKNGGYKIVTTDELKKWTNEGGRMLIISTLPATDDKDLGRIPTAVTSTMPGAEKDITQDDKDLLIKTAGMERDRTIVVYCGFVACRRSHIGAKLLVDEGFTNVYRYPAGILGWKEMGYPTTK